MSADIERDEDEARALATAQAAVRAADRARRSVPAVEPMRGAPPEILPDPPAAELDWMPAAVAVMGPDDRLIIAMGTATSAQQADRMRAQLKALWPDVADRIAFVNGPVAGLAVIEGGAE